MKQAKYSSLTRIALPLLQRCAILTQIGILVLLSTDIRAQDAPAETTNTETTPETKPYLEPKTSERHHIDTEKLKELRYAEQFADDGYVKLKAAGQMFAGLWSPARGEKQYGAVLLLHGEGQNPDWPNTLRIIRQNLADFGWSTLSISLPDPRIRVYAKNTARQKDITNENNEDLTDPQAKKNEKPPSSPVAKKTNDQYDVETLVQQRIDAAFTFLNQKGQFNIIIAGEGLGATRAARYSFITLQKGGEKSNRQMNDANQRPIRALAMINPVITIPNIEKTLKSFLNLPDLPMLDVFAKTHYEKSLAAKDRKKHAKLNRIKTYIQHGYTVNTAKTTQNATAITRRVRGFLNGYARGVEIDKK